MLYTVLHSTAKVTCQSTKYFKLTKKYSDNFMFDDRERRIKEVLLFWPPIDKDDMASKEMSENIVRESL